MSKYILIIIIAALILVGIAYVYMVKLPAQQGAQGRVVFSVTDAAASATVEDATEILVTIDKLEVHSSASGWVTLSTQVKQYELLELKASGASALLADANLAAGTYEQIRLHVSKVEVTVDGEVQEAKLPSNSLKIVGNFTVVAGETTTLSLDFEADKSLHRTGNGKYIFAPVILLEVRDKAEVEIDTDGEVIVRGGDVETHSRSGMDEKGESRADFQLEGKLEIDDNGMIKVEGSAGAGAGTPSEIVLNFTAQNNSGVSGTATLSEADGKVRVKLALSNGTLGANLPPEPAHVHVGACPSPGAVKYPLNSVIAGKSETVINVSWANLKAQLPLAINVHKSATDLGTYIACTDVKF